MESASSGDDTFWVPPLMLPRTRCMSYYELGQESNNLGQFPHLQDGDNHGNYIKVIL